MCFQFREKDDTGLKEFYAKQGRISIHRAQAVSEAVKELPLLVQACAGRSGQSFYIRGILFSLWNGKPADLSDVLNLDWELKVALCAVVKAFGSEGFFYKEIEAAFKESGQLEWFKSEGEE